MICPQIGTAVLKGVKQRQGCHSRTITFYFRKAPSLAKIFPKTPFFGIFRQHLFRHFPKTSFSIFSEDNFSVFSETIFFGIFRRHLFRYWQSSCSQKKKTGPEKRSYPPLCQISNLCGSYSIHIFILLLQDIMSSANSRPAARRCSRIGIRTRMSATLDKSAAATKKGDGDSDSAVPTTADETTAEA